MAKKKEKLSLEEKLVQALVPQGEWPYEVPENWCWTKLSSSITLISGRDVATTQCNDTGDGVPYILGASNIQNDTFQVERWIANPVVVSIKGDILLSVKGTIGKIYEQVEDKINISRQIMALRANCNVSSSYLKQYLIFKSGEFSQMGNGLIPGISREIILNTLFPTPPLSEQHRIVARIESLFAKLDEAKELAQSALDSFENRKAAILHQAFTGELTKGWREVHGVGMESWENVLFRQILDVRDGTHDSPVYQDEGYPLITSKNLKNGKLTYDNVKYISKEDYASINLRSRVDIGDILFAMIGTIGNPVVITDDVDYAIKNVALLKNINKVNSFFVRYYLETKYVRDKMLKEAKGTTQKFVSLGYLRNFPIHLPTLPEQTEIVRILDNLFDKESQAKELCSVIEQIDLMKKAILARAFRGELGTNVAEEESAVELLREILSKG